MTCPVCGTVALPGARYCHNCGSLLPGAVGEGFAAERRIVTVLFGDLSDFTAWSEEHDPERVGRLTDRVLAASAQAVTAFGGHVDKLTGDGIMAVFGAPVAHEDDPERAVRAALAMRRAVRRVIDDEVGGGHRLGLRVGVNTGPVVAGVQAALSYTVIGDTVNTAARLSDAAGVSSVYAGAATARATRDRAAWRRLPPLRLKGKREPVVAFELLGLRDAPGIRPGLGDEAPFVGREVELGRILGRFAEVVERREPQVMVITADAGGGKTRLAGEAAREVGAQFGARVLQTRCAPYGERRLAPLADLVRKACGIEPDDEPAAAADRVRRLAARLSRQTESDTRPSGSDEQFDLPSGPSESDGRQAGSDGRPSGSEGLTPAAVLELLDLVELGADGEGRVGIDPPSPVGSRPRGQLPAAVAALISALAGEDPVMVAIDDTHNAAAETLEAFGVLVARLTGPVLVLMLGRPELVRTPHLLSRLPVAEPLQLQPLSGAAAARLLRSYLGGGQLSGEDENQLLATALGNPFYLAELVTLLVEQGRLTGGADGWRLAPGSLSGRLLSRNLAAVLTARIDTLAPEVRSVLRDAAVVGDTVPEGALEALRGTPRSDELSRSVAELVSRRMLRRDYGGYAFGTTLMKEAVYSGMGQADLADRHARIARWADSRPIRRMTEIQRDEFIAHHAERAAELAAAMVLPSGHDARSVGTVGAAALGRLAAAALAAGEAGRALRLLDRASALGPDVVAPSTRLARARALLATGNTAEALVESEQALGDGDPRTRAAARLVAGEAHWTTGAARAAVAAWSAAMREAHRNRLPTYESEALRRIGMLDYLSGRLRLAEDRFAASYRLAAGSGDVPGMGWALQHLAWSATSRGDFPAAERAVNRALEVFTELADSAGRSWASGTEAFVRLLQGRFADARRLADEFVPYGARTGDHWGVAAMRTVEAFAAAELGALAHAGRQARRAFDGFGHSGDPWGRSLALTVRGLAARNAGRTDLAMPLLAEALWIGGESVHPLTVGIAMTIRGYCRLAAGDATGAEADARATLGLLGPLEVEESARVGPVVLLAQARRYLGDLDAALELLGEVASRPATPSLLFPRRQALAHYSGVLVEAGKLDEAVDWARRAQQVPAEDVRSRVVADRALAIALSAVGAYDEALAAAERAVALAYATELSSERASSDTVRDRVALAAATAGPSRAAEQ